MQEVAVTYAVVVYLWLLEIDLVVGSFLGPLSLAFVLKLVVVTLSLGMVMFRLISHRWLLGG